MKRRHSRAQSVALVERLKAARPELAIGADLIAGFPTEDDAMFADTLALIDDADIVHAHIFPYSPRTGTPPRLRGCRRSRRNCAASAPPGCARRRRRGAPLARLPGRQRTGRSWSSGPAPAAMRGNFADIHCTSPAETARSGASR